MKPLAMAGLLLIGLGIAGLIFGRFSYTTDKKVIDMGPLTASVAETHDVAIPDIAGIAAIVAGAVLIFLGSRKST